MKGDNLYNLNYPIGEFITPKTITRNTLKQWISIIENFPMNLEAITRDLSEDELNLTYRPKGWTIRQVIHHCADSHMNSIIRFKLALTENKPVIRPYFEDRWAQLLDYEKDVEPALQILKGVHAKLSILLRNFSDEELKRNFVHPEHRKSFSVKENIGLYAWHCNYHLAHVKQALIHRGKF